MKVLIISPYFPPANAADMQRIRMSLPYFKKFDCFVEVMAVNMQEVDIVKDDLLIESVPNDITIHWVSAFSKKWTSKIGLGSIALRSLIYFYRGGCKLLESKKIDLVYFSTTQFPVCILGAFWKRKYNVPYIIDMQDPWYSTYYLSKPRNERPSKFWLSYFLNKFMEPIAMNSVDGIISVSSAYIDILKERYLNIKNIPTEIITFGAFSKDFDIAKNNISFQYNLNENTTNIVYVGRGGADMVDAVTLLFNAFKLGLKNKNHIYNNIRFYFIGTSYATNGKGIKSIEPISIKFGINDYVIEETDRLPFYATLNLLQKADVLFIPGSSDSQYTASKIYPYIMANKPIIAIFNALSSAVAILRKCTPENCVSTFQDEHNQVMNSICLFLENIITNRIKTMTYNDEVFKEYSAVSMVEKQVTLFNKIVNQS